MRDIFKKATVGAFIAGAALTLAACGGGSTAANNTATNDLGMEPALESNDMGLDANMTMDANATMMDTNATMDANATMTDANMSNGM